MLYFLVQAVTAVIRARTPPGPPGGRVVAVHNEQEWTDAQRDAKDSGALVRAPRVRAPRVRAVAARALGVTTPWRRPRPLTCGALRRRRCLRRRRRLPRLRSWSWTLARTGARRAAPSVPSMRRSAKRRARGRAASCTLRGAHAAFAQYPQATFLKVDVDEAKSVARQCGIRSESTQSHSARAWADTHTRLTPAPRCRHAVRCRRSTCVTRCVCVAACVQHDLCLLTRAAPPQLYLGGSRVEEFKGANAQLLEQLLVKHGARAAPPPAPPS
jgi:hypothetical protein